MEVNGFGGVMVEMKTNNWKNVNCKNKAKGRTIDRLILLRPFVAENIMQLARPATLERNYVDSFWSVFWDFFCCVLGRTPEQLLKIEY